MCMWCVMQFHVEQWKFCSHSMLDIFPFLLFRRNRIEGKRNVKYSRIKGESSMCGSRLQIISIFFFFVQFTIRKLAIRDKMYAAKRERKRKRETMPEWKKEILYENNFIFRSLKTCYNSFSLAISNIGKM